jgi:hypothetical protein
VKPEARQRLKDRVDVTRGVEVVRPRSAAAQRHDCVDCGEGRVAAQTELTEQNQSLWFSTEQNFHGRRV